MKYFICHVGDVHELVIKTVSLIELRINRKYSVLPPVEWRDLPFFIADNTVSFIVISEVDGLAAHEISNLSYKLAVISSGGGHGALLRSTDSLFNVCFTTQRGAITDLTSRKLSQISRGAVLRSNVLRAASELKVGVFELNRLYYALKLLVFLGLRWREAACSAVELCGSDVPVRHLLNFARKRAVLEGYSFLKALKVRPITPYLLSRIAGTSNSVVERVAVQEMHSQVSRTLSSLSLVHR